MTEEGTLGRDGRGARQALRVGLTGGIASGKSMVAAHFESLGVPVIDTDVIAREVVAPGAPALEEIREAFGDEVFTNDGALDRRAMRQRIFADAEDRKRLEAMLHPRIRDRTSALAEAVQAPYMVIVVPLLAESAMRHFMDRILVVDCSKATQLARLTARDSESREQARRMIAAQASREERLAIADDVIDNDGSIESTLHQVEALHERYLALTSDSDS